MRTFIALLGLVLLLPAGAEAARLKDIGQWKGVQSNDLIGQGLVVGLAGTGDGGEAVRQFLRNLGQNEIGTLASTDWKSKNAAVVTVTATLPPFARKGDTIDVTVAAVQDAKSLAGGVLVATMMRDVNQREVWAVAQGGLTVGGFSAGAGGSSAAKNHVTTARVPGGARITQDLVAQIEHRTEMTFSLAQADFTTAVRTARTINASLRGDFARAVDSSAVDVLVPPQYQGRVPEMVAALEALSVDTDSRAKVVLNERTGTVVMGSQVSIHTVAIAHAGLTIQVDTQFGVSQPGPFSEGVTAVTPDSEVVVTEEGGDLRVVGGVSIGEVVGALNQLGVAPRDLISILQAIHRAGAMDATLEML